MRVFRNKKPGGKYYGSYRLRTSKSSGKSISLQTQDADEAQRRARLWKKKLWSPSSPVEGAAAAAAAAMDPGTDPPADPPPPDDPPAAHAGTTETGGAGAPEREPLDDAAQAAAAEASGAKADYIPPGANFEDEIQAAMGDLGVGGDADLLEQAADGVAALLLWAEGKAVELGVNWSLKRRGRTERLVVGTVAADGAPRKVVRICLKAQALRSFPTLFQKLEPWMGIVVGLVMGAGVQIQGAHFVDKDGNPVTAPSSPPSPNGATASSPA